MSPIPSMYKINHLSIRKTKNSESGRRPACDYLLCFTVYIQRMNSERYCVDKLKL